MYQVKCAFRIWKDRYIKRNTKQIENMVGRFNSKYNNKNKGIFINVNNKPSRD